MNRFLSLSGRARGAAVALVSALFLTAAAYGGYSYHASSVTARINAGIAATESASPDLGTAAFNGALTYSGTFTSGTAAGMVDVLWSDTRTLAASGRDSLDLSGVLTTALNQTFSPAKIKAVMITAAAGNTNNVVVGGASAGGWVGFFGDVSDKIVLKPGYMFLLGGTGTGFTVTNSSADALLIINSAGTTTVTYSIVVLGTSA